MTKLIAALSFRCAIKDDLPVLVNLLANDPLGAKRENSQEPLGESYKGAFEAIQNDPNNELIVAEINDNIVGMLQLTFIPYLTYQGSWRCLIEGVRVHQDHRNQGVGHVLIEYGIEHAKLKKCHLVQLTADKQRSDALRFYESLGFINSHHGLKLHLPLTESE
jgi:ribosomal protein S18 acetylase RimI-like enzyme